MSHVKFEVHQAHPYARSSGALVWVHTPIDNEKPFDNAVTIFFASPGDAKELGEQLIREATKASRIAAIEAESANEREDAPIAV